MVTKYKVVREHIKSYDPAPSFLAGTHLKMEERNEIWNSWIWCHDNENRSAWIPEQLLSVVNNVDAILKDDYDSNELTVHAGEVVEGHKIYDGWVWCKNTEKMEGWIPLDNLETVLLNNKA
ncbi:SH3 domain-containing protein [Cuniculiplasma sp. SKW4]|uniref:SH3 domain-containing protein n=1 Tax=Cuniculiplasma sp. SKW4 TaxID=3400171 RepID=UPI003FD68917